MTSATKGKILCGLALAIDVGVPLAATLSQFHVWVDRSADAAVAGVFLSGLSIALILVCFIPAFRQIKEYLKSPSAPFLWTVLFVLFAILESIASEIKIICFFGMLANLLGASLYKIGKNMEEKEKTE
jgi:predicted MFS family arabinose efflux permease